MHKFTRLRLTGFNSKTVTKHTNKTNDVTNYQFYIVKFTDLTS